MINIFRRTSNTARRTFTAVRSTTGDAFAAKHPRMHREKRAKQFAPFDALSGFSESIEEKNHIYYTD